MILLDQLRQDYKKIKFVQGNRYAWSPKRQTIYYCLPICNYSLLHELGHAIKQHKRYGLDIELIRLEDEAWQQAIVIGKLCDIRLRQPYIKDCMNTYRDWLAIRARCPECKVAGIQSATTLLYSCLNCGLSWQVTKKTECISKHSRNTLKPVANYSIA